MSITAGKEFNAAAFDENTKRHQIALESRGSDVISTAFTKPKMGAGQGDAPKDQRFLDALQIIEATNSQLAEQQRLYMAKLNRYEKTLDVAEIEYLQRYQDLLANAYELDDGTKVFFSEDGHGYDEAGQKIDDQLIAHIPEDERGKYTSHEELQGAAQDIEDVRKAKDDVANARDKLEAGDMDADELDRLDKQLQQSVADATANSPSSRQFAASAGFTLISRTHQKRSIMTREVCHENKKNVYEGVQGRGGSHGERARGYA